MDKYRAFIDSVEKAFLGEPAKYQEFLKILNDCRENGLEAANVIVRMEKLLKDHKDLLFKFMVFLPPYTELNIPPKARASRAISFVLAVQKAFGDESAKYDEFIKIFKGYTANTLDLEDVLEKLEALFKKHQNLLLGFILFIPTAQRNASPAADKFVAKLKKSFQGDDRHVLKSFHKILVKFKEGDKQLNEVVNEGIKLLQGHDDLVMEFTNFFGGRPVRIVTFIARLLQL